MVLQPEVVLPVFGGGSIAISTRGSSAFRVRFLPADDHSASPIHSSMVRPVHDDAHFERLHDGISTMFGALRLTVSGELQLFDAAGKLILSTLPLLALSSERGSRIHLSSMATVAVQDACELLCRSTRQCMTWVYGSRPGVAGNCWMYEQVNKTTHLLTSPERRSISLSAQNNVQLYGGGGGGDDATRLVKFNVTAYVDNRVTYAPHYYSTDGYACLGLTNITSGEGKSNVLPVSYSYDGKRIVWSHRVDSSFELYLMPASTLDLGTSAYYSLIGFAAVPPRWAFGFFASRWGWQSRSYIETVIRTFREQAFPIDAIIIDFEWFSNTSDYGFPPAGVHNFDDFGYNLVTFPQPKLQLAKYFSEFHIRMGGIRKPRLGGTRLLREARDRGFLLAGCERRRLAIAEGLPDEGYACDRNLNFSNPAARDWYAAKQAHYLRDGVAFFWNDEGETDYYTFYEWNAAQLLTLASFDPSRRFYSINRAWSPGMARLGATVWTGDIFSTWQDLRNTIGLVLNWALGGAPYVACDIGGFDGETSAPLLTRWFQLGAFMPTMRIHSTISSTPHFPWLWGEPYASVMRSALELRYRLLPYHYSFAHNMYETGRLWIRPLAAEFPLDHIAAACVSQFLDGELLVAPIVCEDSTRHIYLPAGVWYSFGTTLTERGPKTLTGAAAINEVPVYVRPGSIVPLAPVAQYSSVLAEGSLEVQVYAGANGSFTFIEDDGETREYERGSVRKTILTWNDGSSTLSWEVLGSNQAHPSMFTELFLHLIDSQGQASSGVVSIGMSGSISVHRSWISI